MIIKSLCIKNKNSIFAKEPKFSKIPCVYACNKKGKIRQYSPKSKIKFGTICIKGEWKQKKEFLEAYNNDKKSLFIITKGRTVNAVMGAHKNKKPTTVFIRINNKILKIIKVSRSGIYKIIKFNKNVNGTLELKTKSNCLKVYSFTFE